MDEYERKQSVQNWEADDGAELQGNTDVDLSLKQTVLAEMERQARLATTALPSPTDAAQIEERHNRYMRHLAEQEAFNAMVLANQAAVIDATDRQRVTLVGGFCCMLTCEEQNEWTEHLRNNEEASSDLSESEALYAHSIHSGAACGKLQLTVAWTDLDDARDAMYDIGKKWHAALVARRDTEKLSPSERPQSEERS